MAHTSPSPPALTPLPTSASFSSLSHFPFLTSPFSFSLRFTPPPPYFNNFALDGRQRNFNTKQFISFILKYVFSVLQTSFQSLQLKYLQVLVFAKSYHEFPNCHKLHRRLHKGYFQSKTDIKFSQMKRPK